MPVSAGRQGGWSGILFAKGLRHRPPQMYALEWRWESTASRGMSTAPQGPQQPGRILLNTESGRFWGSPKPPTALFPESAEFWIFLAHRCEDRDPHLGGWEGRVLQRTSSSLLASSPVPHHTLCATVTPNHQHCSSHTHKHKHNVLYLASARGLLETATPKHR